MGGRAPVRSFFPPDDSVQDGQQNVNVNPSRDVG